MAINTRDKRFSAYDAMLEARKINIVGLFLLLAAAFFCGMGAYAFYIGSFMDFIYFVGIGIVIYAADLAAYLFRMKREENIQLQKDQYKSSENPNHERGGP